MNQLYFNKKNKKNYEIIAFMAKEICDCLLHFAGRKSGFRDAGNLCWDPQATQLHLEWQPSLPSSGALSLWGTIWCTSSVFLLIFWKQNTRTASENNSNEVSSAVPHPALLTTCKQLASVFPSLKRMTYSINHYPDLQTHTHTEKPTLSKRHIQHTYRVSHTQNHTHTQDTHTYWESHTHWERGI